MCLVLLFRFISLSIRCSKTKNHCVANDLSVTVISNRKCHENEITLKTVPTLCQK
jgi:hypothetical protein